MERPTKPCYVCGSSTWWQRPDGGWLCGRCHPNPNPGPGPIPGDEAPQVSQPNKGKYSSETLALRDRVILGNKKLNDAWEQIKGMVPLSHKATSDASDKGKLPLLAPSLSGDADLSAPHWSRSIHTYEASISPPGS
ncbi:unnamed protein product [marine sediment metagenome]|uniref:Uncharacterized protein n=1 Tax=marine sediment metagenome TaxID=412755 RepID=X1GG38_9ZZZZ